MEKNIRIGWAQTDITPDRPIYVIGQLYSRISSYVHDPLTATCLVLENGQEQMILVSADMPGVPTMHISRILERLDAPGLDRSRVVFSAIHTHNSTMFTKNTTYEVYFKSVLGDLCPISKSQEKGGIHPVEITINSSVVMTDLPIGYPTHRLLHFEFSKRLCMCRA
jgi:hypothetical protein